MKKGFKTYILLTCLLFLHPQKAEAKFLAQNPFAEGILSTFSSKKIQKSIVNTSEVVGTTSKGPTGDMGTGVVITIKKLGISEELRYGKNLNSELLVGPGEVLTGTINGARVIYAHNGSDRFGKIYQLSLGDSLSVGDEYEKTRYRLVKKDIVGSEEIANLVARENTLYLVTCSFSEPNKRHLLQFVKQK